MAPILRPLFTWGDAMTQTVPYGFLNGALADLTMTQGVADPFGGTSAVRLDDLSNLQSVGPYWMIAELPGGNVEYWWAAKWVSGSTRSAFRLFDVTAGLDVIYQRWDWAAGAPTNIVQVGVAYTSLGVHSLGNGWYLFGARTLTPPLATGYNQLRLVLYSCLTTAELGAVDWWVGNVVVAPYPVDAMVSSPEMDEGSATEMMPNGAHQAWVNEWQYDVTMDVRYIPVNGQGPANLGPGSGWDGEGFGAPGANMGFAGLRQALEDGEVVKFCPNVFDASVIYSVTGAVEGGAQLIDRDDALTRSAKLRISTLVPVPGL